MKHVVCAVLLLFALTAEAAAETRVWLMRGMGGTWFGIAPGVDNIAAKERRLPGVTSVRVFEYQQTQQIANEIQRTPRNVRVVVGGYSCGANSATAVAAAFKRSRPIYVEGIQASKWCGSYTLSSNVTRAQLTYNANCFATIGLGCRVYVPGPGFEPSRLTLIHRPDSHGYADDDPDAQNDMVSFVRNIEAGKLGATPQRRGHVRLLTRYRGQTP